MLRQVRTVRCLADIVAESSEKFRVDFFPTDPLGVPGPDGIYPVTGLTPFKTWSFQGLPSEPGETVQVVESTAFSSVTSLVAHASGTWTMNEANGMRVRTLSNQISGDLRTETKTVEDSTGVLAEHSVTTYRTFPWGERIIEHRIDPGQRPGNIQRTDNHLYLL